MYVSKCNVGTMVEFLVEIEFVEASVDVDVGGMVQVCKGHLVVVQVYGYIRCGGIPIVILRVTIYYDLRVVNVAYVVYVVIIELCIATAV
jgi:hypothetical protein